MNNEAGQQAEAIERLAKSITTPWYDGESLTAGPGDKCMPTF